MKKIIISMIAIFISASANAEYVMKIGLDKEAINFKQYYENVGVSPDDNNNTTKDPACTISQADLAPFGGQLIKVSDEESLKCVVDYIVPKATFSPDCTSEYLPISMALANVMISKGVKGYSSIGYYGECSI
ncbi:hypothetical protein [Pseudomonas extremaustralis]